MSGEGLAGQHHAAVRHSIEQVGVVIESTRLTREHGTASVETAERLAMSGTYMAASLDVLRESEQAVNLLIQARGKLEALATALLNQGA